MSRTVLTPPQFNVAAYRELLNAAFGWQLPLRQDPDTQVFWSGKNATYDSEQGGFPLDLPPTSSSKALAIACTDACRSMYFGNRADGTAALWLDGRANSTRLYFTAPTLTSSTVFVVEGRVYPQMPVSAAALLVEWPSRYIGIDINAGGTDATFRVYDGTTVHFPAGSIATALGFNPDGNEWEWRAVVGGTSVDLDVRPVGGSWTTVVSGLTIVSSALSGTVEMTTDFTTQGFRGQYNLLRVRDGGTGASIVAEFTPGLFVAGNRGNGDTAVDAYGVTWTLTRPTSVGVDEPKVIEAGARRFVLSGVSGEYIETPDTAANSITGDIDIRYFGTSTTSASNETLVAKWSSSAGQRGYMLQHLTDGTPRLLWTTDGTSLGIGAGTAVWDGTGALRATLDVDNGSTQHVVQFFTSADDGVTWTQLGSTVTNSGTTSIFDGTGLGLSVGAHVGQSYALLGDVRRVEVYDGIDGTLVERIDAADADPDASTFTSATSGATVTINRTTSANYHVEVAEADVAAIQTDGINDYAVVIGDDSVSDFVGATGLTLTADVRQHQGTSSYGRIVSALNASNNGIMLGRYDVQERLYTFGRTAGAINVGDNADNITYGQRTVAVGAWGSSDHEFYTDGVSREADATALADHAYGEPVTVGADPDGTDHGAVTVFAVGVIADRVVDADAATISQELRL